MRRHSLTTVLLAGLISLGPASQAGAAHQGNTGAFTVDTTIAYPAFPCHPIDSECIAPWSGTITGHAAGVHGTTPWQVSFDGAQYSSTIWYVTLPIFDLVCTCFYENSRADVTAVDSSVTGTYGTTPVESVPLDTQLGYLRFGERAGIALDFFQLRLGLAGGGEVVVTDPAQQAAVGAGTWEIVDGTPQDCEWYDSPAPVTARLQGAAALD